MSQAILPATLIVCSRNRPRLLFESVKSVLDGDEVPSEIIIVDQSDVPIPDLGRLQTALRDRLRYLWSQTVGLSRANNIGVAAARHDLLVFTHDDVRVAPDWFGSIVRALVAGGSRTVVTGRVLPAEAEKAAAFVPCLNESPASTIYEGRICEDVLYPLNMAIYRSALNEVGRFDERLGPGTRFPGAEDNDLGFRLLEAGYRIANVPEAVLYHRAWRSDYLHLRWTYGCSQGAFYSKHFSFKDPYTLTRMRKEVVHRARRFIHRSPREWRVALGDLLYIAALVLGAGAWQILHARERHGQAPLTAIDPVEYEERLL